MLRYGYFYSFIALCSLFSIICLRPGRLSVYMYIDLLEIHFVKDISIKKH